MTSYTETDPVFSGSPAGAITNTEVSNWNTAYGWGDHTLAGYLTTFVETDPVFTGSPAGAITNTEVSNWNTAYGWGDHGAEGYAVGSFTNTTINTSLTLSTSATSFNITRDLSSGATGALERLFSGTYTQLVTNATETVNLFTIDTAAYTTCRYTITWTNNNTGAVNISEWLVASDGSTVAINEQRANGTTVGTKPLGTNNAVISGGIITVRATTNSTTASGVGYSYTIHAIQYV